MQVTEIKVFPVEEEKLKAFVSIVFDHCFMVNDIKVIKGRDGLFISMPSRRKKNGKFKDVAHPLNNDTRQMIERLILADYERALRREEEQPAAAAPERRHRKPAAPERPQERPAAAAPERPEEEPAAPAPERREEPLEYREPLAAKGGGEEPTEDGKSLEEVTELHLRDSFWNS